MQHKTVADWFEKEKTVNNRITEVTTVNIYIFTLEVEFNLVRNTWIVKMYCKIIVKAAVPPVDMTRFSFFSW